MKQEFFLKCQNQVYFPVHHSTSRNNTQVSNKFSMLLVRIKPSSSQIGKVGNLT